MIEHRPLHASSPLPLLIAASEAQEASLRALSSWAAAERDWIEERLLAHGALLLRGFEITAAEEFASLCRQLGGELKPYIGGDSPRSAVAERVYTSTEFAPELEVFLHNELSYSGWWPSKIFFCCGQPARSGGETQLADSREILRRLPRDLVGRFAERGVRYLQNLRDQALDGPGKSWQATFETTDRAAAEAHFRRAGMTWHWTEWGLSTAIVRPGVLAHPKTGEPVWFNQADQWHQAAGGPKHIDAVASATDEATTPCHATFGDGTEIPTRDIETIRTAAHHCEVLFTWQRGDVLVLDNLLTAHGRKPFTGKRAVFVAMT